ncbi:MAG: response regulator [Bacteroidetes bacterium]|nr:response regulator [Bacteroidota bacterium]
MTKKKILLADDDADDRSIFEQILAEKNNVELLAAVENGLEILEYLKVVSDGHVLPDLIILDHNMPRMNGRQTLGYLKSSDEYHHIPVVIYSTYSDAKLVDECSMLGASLVASKPAGFNEYRDMINEFLKIVSA